MILLSVMPPEFSVVAKAGVKDYPLLGSMNKKKNVIRIIHYFAVTKIRLHIALKNRITTIALVKDATRTILTPT